MDLARRHVDAVARTRVEGRLSARSALEMHLTNDHVDHRFMRPVVMPARRPARFRPNNADPEISGVDGLFADHPRGLPGLLVAIGWPDEPGLLALQRFPVFLLGLPALVLDVELSTTAHDPAPNALTRRRLRG